MIAMWLVGRKNLTGSLKHRRGPTFSGPSCRVVAKGLHRGNDAGVCTPQGMPYALRETVIPLSFVVIRRSAKGQRGSRLYRLDREETTS